VAALVEVADTMAASLAGKEVRHSMVVVVIAAKARITRDCY
jgi:hypothetical protein